MNYLFNCRKIDKLSQSILEFTSPNLLTISLLVGVRVRGGGTVLIISTVILLTFTLPRCTRCWSSCAFVFLIGNETKDWFDESKVYFFHITLDRVRQVSLLALFKVFKCLLRSKVFEVVVNLLVLRLKHHIVFFNFLVVHIRYNLWSNDETAFNIFRVPPRNLVPVEKVVFH